jgi:hypothetical protein
MADVPTNSEAALPPEIAKERSGAVQAIILSGWALSALTAFVIVIGAVYSLVFSPDHSCPPVLREWAGMTLGFLFGTFMTMVKDFIGKTG